MVNKLTPEYLLKNGYIKVDSKTYCEYWKKGDEIITLNTDETLSEYNRGYEDALRAIKVNLEHFKKDVHSIEMIYDSYCVERYEGERDCEKLLFSEILGMNE